MSILYFYLFIFFIVYSFIHTCSHSFLLSNSIFLLFCFCWLSIYSSYSCIISCLSSVFVLLLIHLFIRAFMYPFIHCAFWFPRLFINLFLHAFVRSYHNFFYFFIYLFIYPCIRLSLSSFILYFLNFLNIYSFIYLSSHFVFLSFRREISNAGTVVVVCSVTSVTVTTTERTKNMLH